MTDAPPRIAWTYLLECADGTLYTGWCYDLDARVALHNQGRGTRYTRSRRPVHLRWCEPHPTRRAAMQREAAIKKLARGEKLHLINSKLKACPEQSEWMQN